jgi:hypothetical protein
MVGLSRSPTPAVLKVTVLRGRYLPWSAAR